jgi:TIR domain
VRLRFKSEHLGKEAKCRSCEQPIVVQGETIPDHDVFIGYSIKDQQIANAVCAALEAKKIRCWIAPRDVLPGKQWAGAILDAISDARVMVLIYSAHANASPQVIREVDRAVNRNIPIIPFRIDSGVMSREMEYYISTAHWLDAMTGPMEGHIATLVETARKLVKGKDLPTTRAPQPAAPSPTVPEKRFSALKTIVTGALIVLLMVICWEAALMILKNNSAGNQASKSAGDGSAVSTSNSAIAVATPSTGPVNPGQVNLLAMVKLPTDVQLGTFTADGRAIVAPQQSRALLEFPFIPPAEYDYRVDFMRVSGNSDICLICAIGGNQFSWDIGWDNATSGFGQLDGMNADKNFTTVKNATAIVNGQRHATEIKVRADRVEAYLDGKLISSFDPRAHQMSLSSVGRPKRPDTLGVKVFDSGYRIESAVVAAISGEGKEIEEPIVDSVAQSAGAETQLASQTTRTSPELNPPGQATGSKSATDQQGQRKIEFVKWIDPAKDAVTGNWSLANGVLTGEQSGDARVELPYTPPLEYDYRVNFTRSAGDQGISLVCYAGGHQFGWEVSGYKNTACGFLLVNGRPSGVNVTSKRQASWISNDQPHTTLVKVRQGAVEGYLDGQLISRFPTDYANLSAGALLIDRYQRKDTIGLLVRSSAVQISSIEVTEITGEGKLLRSPAGLADDAAAANQTTKGTLCVLCKDNMEAFLNGKSILTSNANDNQVHKIPLMLNKGDVLLFRASSGFVFRDLRFAFVGVDNSIIFASKARDAILRPQPDAQAVVPADWFQGITPKAGRGSDPQNLAWTENHLPENAEWIQVPERNTLYEIEARVP